MHQGLVDLRRRMAHAEGHIQQDDGQARHLRHIRRDGQIPEKGLVGTAEQCARVDANSDWPKRRGRAKKAYLIGSASLRWLCAVLSPYACPAWRRDAKSHSSRASGANAAMKGLRLFMRGQGVLL